MIDDLKLYAIGNHQLANRQYNIGTKVSNLTFTGVKHTGNPIQEIQLPNVSDVIPATYNLVQLGNKWYDIVGFNNATFDSASMKLSLVYNPIVTLLSSGKSLTGFWNRTPSKVNLGAKVSIADDSFKTSRSVKLGALPDYNASGTLYTSFFYQITSKYDLATSKPTSGLYSYVGMAPWIDYFMSYEIPFGYDITTGADAKMYLSLWQLMDDLDTITGLPSDSIVDISISRRCPWRTVPSGKDYPIMNYSNTEVAPLPIAGNWSLIKIDNSGAKLNDYWTLANTLTLSDFERYCGRVYVVDDVGNAIGEIPTELFNASNQMTYYFYTVPDYAQLTTHFRFLDRVLIMQEGRLPWVGDAWQDYVSRTQAYDRAELSDSVKRVDRQKEIDMLGAISSGLLTSAVGASGGNIAGAGLGIAQTGVGLVTSQMNADLTKEMLYSKQRNKEGLIKNSPSNFYQTGYGIDYMTRAIETGGAHIRIETPANTTESDFNSYISYAGYPCGKVATISLSAGFIQGNLFTVPSGANGPELDMLRRELANGVRVVT